MNAWIRRPQLLIAAGVTALSLAIVGPAIAMLPGSDVASHQHPGATAIDWGRVKDAGHAFAIVKATEGITYVNPHYAEDSVAMQKAGIVRGTYHYALPQFPAIAQARHYAAVLATHTTPLDLPPVLDLEETGGLGPLALQAWVRTFLTTLDSITGRTTIIYVSPGFWRYQMNNTTEFSDRPLWIADYNGGTAPTMPLPGGWKDWTFWQYTGNGQVDGVSTPIDLNTFNGDKGELLALTRQYNPNARANRLGLDARTTPGRDRERTATLPGNIKVRVPSQSEVDEIVKRLPRDVPPEFRKYLR